MHRDPVVLLDDRELQSFSAAARELRLSNAAVSKHVAALEHQLATRLLQRTTRKVAVTPAGSAYLARCARLLDELAELDGEVRRGNAEPRGLLRVNAPNAFGLLHLTPLVPGLLAAHPELSLDVSLSDRFVDLVEEGVDVVIRVANELPDSGTLVAQKLVASEHCVVASPDYLAAHGRPRRIADLARHDCLVYGMRGDARTFVTRGTPVTVPVHGRYRVDNSLALRDAVRGGAGLAMMPRFYVDDDLRDGALERVLDGAKTPHAWIHAVYPRQRHLSTKIRVFIEHVRVALRTARWAIRA